MARQVRWTIDLCICDVLEGDDYITLFECYDDEAAVRHVYDALAALGLNPEYAIILYRQDRRGIGWSEGIEISRVGG